MDEEIATSTRLADLSGYYSDPGPNDPYIYDHFEPTRQVLSFGLKNYFNSYKQHLLWVAMSSIESRLDLINSHCLSCTKYKGIKHIGLDFLGDSSASLHITYAKSDFAEYEHMDGPLVQTADKNSCLQISGLIIPLTCLLKMWVYKSSLSLEHNSVLSFIKF